MIQNSCILNFLRVEISKAKVIIKKGAGFTLIELLIVIAVIAIIAAVVFVALDPLTRFRDARDSTRWSDTTSILDAIKIDQVDNGGAYVTAVTNLTAGEVYMVGTAVSTCDDNNASCDTNVTDDDNCVDLTALATEGYLASVPISPTGAVTWSAATAGYTVQRDSTGILHVRACESENTTEISVSR
jgi:prepilin-type N-terminal cleavage/methylation domain-containing protein